MVRHVERMGVCEWLKISWNYKLTGRRVRESSRRRWKEDFESGTGISCLIRKDKKKKELIASNKEILISKKDENCCIPQETPGIRIHRHSHLMVRPTVLLFLLLFSVMLCRCIFTINLDSMQAYCRCKQYRYKTI